MARVRDKKRFFSGNDARYRRKIVKVIIVDSAGNGDYTTVAGAITVAVSGDIIYVMPGTYSENNLTLPSGVSLKGIDKLNSIIQSSSTPILKVAGNNVISDITIDCTHASGVAITDNSANVDNVYVHDARLGAEFDVIQIFNTGSDNWLFEHVDFIRVGYDGGNIAGTNIRMKDVHANVTMTNINETSFMNQSNGSFYIEDSHITLNKNTANAVSFIRTQLTACTTYSRNNIVNITNLGGSAYGFTVGADDVSSNFYTYQDTINLTGTSTFHFFGLGGVGNPVFNFLGGNLSTSSGTLTLTPIAQPYTKASQFESTIATGTPPLVVASTTAVTNLTAGRNVLKSGDTMTGDLIISKANPTITLDDSTSLASNLMDIDGLTFTDSTADGIMYLYTDYSSFIAGEALVGDLYFNGTQALFTNNSVASAGSNCTIAAQNAITGQTNLNGGNLLIKSGNATGTGTSNIQLWATGGGVSGTATVASALMATIGFGGLTMAAGKAINLAGSGSLNFASASTGNIVLGTTTGTKIGTATTQKIGFWNATPVVQPLGTDDILSSLVTTGLRAASSNPPLNMGTGALTCGNVGCSQITITDANNVVLGSTTGTKIGTATTQKLALWNTTPIVQPANTVAIDTVLTNTGLRASGGASNFDTDVKVGVVGKGLYIKEGTNATMGVAVLTMGSATVSTTKVTANSRIFLTHQENTGTIGVLSISGRTAGTSFNVASTGGAGDSNQFAWLLIEPA